MLEHLGARDAGAAIVSAIETVFADENDGCVIWAGSCHQEWSGDCGRHFWANR